MVHYAEGTGELSIHATIGIKRQGGTWFDLVYDELVKKHQQSKRSDNHIIHPDVIENMVQSTQLGVRLAQLVPVGAVSQLYPTTASDPPLDELFFLYMDELVDAVLFHATTLSIMPQPNAKIYGRGYLQELTLQHMIERHFCPDVDPKFEPIVPSERSTAARVASLQVSDNEQNYLGLARSARQVKAKRKRARCTSIVLVTRMCFSFCSLC